MERILIVFLVLWGTTLAAQSGEVVGTFSVESSTGSDPSPTVTGYFNSTVGFLPQSVDTGDILLVRQVFAGNHRRKLYRITGITGNYPLTLNVTLIEGVTGGAFPAGSQTIMRPTTHGSLYDVPNASQEQESYAMNYTINNLESMDLDTVEERNDSLFAVLNNGDEFYVGPTAATAIDTSYQVGDSIYIVSAGDTIFSGIAYANPEIDTIYNDGTNYYMVTVEGDTIEIGAVAQVVANGVHPTNPPTYLVHIDTLGTDTIYFDNNGVWVRFNVGGTQIGAPLFYALNDIVTTFHPAGVPPIGALIYNPYLGCWMRKFGVTNIAPISLPDGRQVRAGNRHFQFTTLGAWDLNKRSAATLGFQVGVDGTIAVPLNISTQERGSERIIILNNTTGSPRTATFSSTLYRDPTGLTPLTSFVVVENSDLTLSFTVDANDSDVIMRLNSLPAASPANTVFQDQVNGLDLTKTGDTVRVSPDITELTYAAVVGADSIMMWDASANAHRRTSISDIVALAVATPVTVTDQANGLDITLTGQDITINNDFGEVANAAVATGDSLLIYDISVPGYRRVTAGSIASLNSSSITGVLDQDNGLDLGISGTSITTEYDIDELPAATTYTGLEKISFKDLNSGTYKTASLSFLSGGYMDLLTNQTAVGVKKFTTGLQYGPGTFPTGIKFGAASQTVFGLKAGTTAALAESVWQDWRGLLIESLEAGTGAQTARFIATGSDAGQDGSIFEFYARPSGAAQNVVKVMTISGEGRVNISLNGSASMNLPTSGLFIDGSVPYTLATEASSTEYTVRRGGGNQLVAYIDGGFPGWQNPSDSLLKDSIVAIELSKQDIRDLGAYSFKWKETDRPDIGVIAQRLLANPTFALAVRGEAPDTLGVNPLGVAAIAIEAASDLQVQIDKLGNGIDTVASASSLPLGEYSKNVVTGTTTINLLSSSALEAYEEVTLIFTASLTVTDGSVSVDSGYSKMELNGGANFSATVDDVLTLIWTGEKFIEKSRSVN